jgi:hypothetical protein
MSWKARFLDGSSYRLFASVLVAVGVLLRLRQYLACESVWTDEAHLLVNLTHASPARVVTGPLNYVPLLVGHPNATQAGPPLALLTIKGFITAWPQSEYAARFLPFISSVLSLPLFALVARRLLTPAAALAALALLALSEPVILQAANAKQYSSDAQAAVVMLFLATLPSPAQPLRRLVVCSLAATVLVWFSHPSVFVYAAASVALGYEAWRGARSDSKTETAGPSRSRVLLSWVAINIPPGVSFLALYWFSVRTQTDPFLRTYWAEGFADYSNPLGLPKWLATQIVEAGSYPPVAFTWVLPVLTFVAMALGSRGTDGRTADESAAPGRMTARFAVTVAAGPLLFVVFAAFMRQYPLVGKRLCFFLLPCTMLAAALGADLLAARLRGVWPRVVAGIVAVVIAGTAIRAASITLDPRSQGDVRAAVRHVLAHRAPGEPVYVWGGKASSVVRFYIPTPDENIHLTADYRKPPEGKTFWVIAQLGRWGTTTEKHDERFEEKLEEMRKEMALTDSLKAHRVGAYRFSREAPPAAPVTPAPASARRADASRGG